MRLSCLLLGTALAFSSCASLKGPPTLTTNTVLSTQYNFRGVPKDARGVIMADATVAAAVAQGGTASATVWGNMGLSDETGDAVFPDDNAREFTEIDGIVDYARTIGVISASFGLINYNFPNVGAESTSEVYAGARWDGLPLHPSLKVFYDFDSFGGFYIQGDISHLFTFNEKTTLEAGITLGWMSDEQAKGYFAINESGVSDNTLRAVGRYVLSDHTTLSAGVYYTSVLDSGLRDGLQALGVEDDNFWAALGMSWHL
jgi:hypothetical protein